jgi:hypothetical protein
LLEHRRGSAVPNHFVFLLTPSRAALTLLLLAFFFAGSIPHLCAQDDGSDVPLGDLARSLRKKPASTSERVIDNDNLPKVMESAETRRAAGWSPVFSLDAGHKNVSVSSPDVTCSLSFTAKTSLSDPLLLDELPREELAKLDGPATLDGDSLQVSLHNGTTWELHEVLIGLTIVRRSDGASAASSFGHARIVPAAAEASQVQDSFQKQPDVTLLLRVKGSAAPSSTAVFRTALNFALFPDQEWHWAIVKAKGVPPAIPQEILTQAPVDPLRFPLPPESLPAEPTSQIPLPTAQPKPAGIVQTLPQ